MLVIVVAIGFAVDYFANQLELNMTAVMIDTNTGAQTETTLTFKGRKPVVTRNGQDINGQVVTGEMDGQFTLGDESIWQFPYSNGAYLYWNLPQYGNENIMFFPTLSQDISANEVISMDICMDLKAGLLMIMSNQRPGVYILASTDSNRTTDEILAHFADVIASQNNSTE